MYHPIECVNDNMTFTDPEFTPAGLIVTRGEIAMRCSNPNSYEVNLDASAEPGKVIVWPEQEEIGVVTLERQVLPARGTGRMMAALTISLTMSQSLMLNAKGTTEVLLDMDVTGVAKLGVLVPGVTIPYNIETTQLCGFEIEASTSFRSGPAVCTLTREQLFAAGIPDISQSTEVFEFTIRLPDETLHDALVLRDSCLISAITVTTLVSLVLCAGLCHQTRRQRMLSAGDPSIAAAGDGGSAEAVKNPFDADIPVVIASV
jgi:hypothetical protein